jgi:hypothetical protein
MTFSGITLCDGTFVLAPFIHEIDAVANKCVYVHTVSY